MGIVQMDNTCCIEKMGQSVCFVLVPVCSGEDCTMVLYREAVMNVI